MCSSCMTVIRKRNQNNTFTCMSCGKCKRVDVCKKMKQILFFGWNGFGQAGNDESLSINHPVVMPVSGSISLVSCSWSQVSVIKDDNLVLIGFVKNKSMVQKELVLPNNVPIRQVSTSTNSTLICAENGTCWRYMTDTDFLQQVVDFVKTESNEEHHEAEDEKVVKVCCSDYINLALSNKGRVFSIPICISIPGIQVVDIACGNEHCILLTDNGVVFSWGNGSRGQLGHGELEPEETPCVISALQGMAVCSISCGAWHCAVVTESGDLYTWGWDCAGQLGRASSQSMGLAEQEKLESMSIVHTEQVTELSDDGPIQTVPVPIDTNSDVKAVSCGARHTIVLLKDNSVWGCGWNFYGQLGISAEECSQSASLRKIFHPVRNKKVTGIVCGGWSTCLILEGD